MKRTLLLLAALAAGLLAGCGHEENAGSPPPSALRPPPASPPAEKLTRTDLDAVPKSVKPYRLTLIVKTRNNPFFQPMIRAAEDEAKPLGVRMEIQAPQQETDSERQFALVQDVVARGVDAILIAPADSKAIVPALKQAQDRGVLVINLDNRVDLDAAKSAGLKIAAYVGADNEEG